MCIDTHKVYMCINAHIHVVTYTSTRPMLQVDTVGQKTSSNSNKHRNTVRAIPIDSKTLETKVLTVILPVFAIIESLNFLGNFYTVTSIFQAPFNEITSSMVIFFSLLGTYGTFKKNRFLLYLSLLAPITILISTIQFLIISKTFLQTIYLVSGVSVLGLSLLCLYTSYRILSYLQVLQPPVTEVGERAKSEYTVELVDVVKIYRVGPIEVSALNGVNLKIKKGEFVAIMGPSGSGKSTLLHIIGALDRPTSGKVIIDGVDISVLSNDELAKLRNKKIGFVFQAYNLINRSTVLRNVELPALIGGMSKKERIGKAIKLLETLGLGDTIYRKPKTLSGGEQQRVAIARAVINDPEIILADEPTGNLDSKSGREVMLYLRKMNRELGTTVIVVTHDREIAEMTDRIVHIRDGKIIGEEVLRRNKT